jgi:addiction module HigA family antidote
MPRIPTDRVTEHPGEFLKELIEDINISGNALARSIGVPPNRITRVVSGSCPVSTDTALRLGRYFGMTPDFWMNAQMAHDLSKANMDPQLQQRITADVQPREAVIAHA